MVAIRTVSNWNVCYVMLIKKKIELTEAKKN